MPRSPRIDIGNHVYHVLNRGNDRRAIFKTQADYRNFEDLLLKARELFNMRILAYTLMPNHWHFVLYPYRDGDLSTFMQWLTLTHTQQHRFFTDTVGEGHLYQGRYKSFLVQTDTYLLTVIKYVERNPVRAGLVEKAESWKWGSAYRRLLGTPKEKQILCNIPVDIPTSYESWINQNDKDEDLENLHYSIAKGKPFGDSSWTQDVVKEYGLQSTLRGSGRPKKGF